MLIKCIKHLVTILVTIVTVSMLNVDERTQPFIKEWSPKSGPWTGGTNITFKGNHLDFNSDNIKVNIILLNNDIVNCLPHKLSDRDARQIIICTVESPINSTLVKSQNV